MRPLAPALLILLSGCAAGTKPSPPPAPAPVAVTPPGKDVVVSTPPEKKHTPLMEAVLTRLKQDGYALDSWTRLSQFPDWASIEAIKSGECEFASPSESPSGLRVAVMDAFDYTVFVGENRKPIVLRTGGFAGVYQIFEAKEPIEPLEPPGRSL